MLRMVRMTAGMVVSEVIGEVPPQAGVQLLPWAGTNASWKAFCPVASIIAAASGGLLSSGISGTARRHTSWSRARRWRPRSRARTR